ncbi:MAG: porin [Thiogranum sp.]
MKTSTYSSRLVAAALLASSSLASAAKMPGAEELWEIIQQQQREIDALKRQQQTTEEKVEATGEVLDSVVTSTTPASAEKTGGLGEKHSPFAHGSSGRTVIGGYGELHYNNLDNQTSGRDDRKEMDLHRAILFLGHEFNDRIRFWSELEVEHAESGEGKDGGEVAMEQAYVEFDLNDNISSRAGLLLVPMGILNEIHEPTTFYGVERNPVENKIIPTTWREGGASVVGRLGTGWSYDLAIHSGLETGPGDSYAVRKGRNNAREAKADDLAYTGRIKWTGMAGLELAAAAQYQTDITQSTDPDAGSATLLESHLVWNRGSFGLRALYATWRLNGDGPEAIGADEQTGWYIEPSWRFTPEVGIFARYNEWDNQAGNSTDSEYKQTSAGINYWPHPDVVLKADYQIQDSPSGKDEFDGFNLGVGYQF